MKDTNSITVKKGAVPASSLHMKQFFSINKNNKNITMMRIAIAGSGGLARTLAYHLNETAHQFIILSRAVCHICHRSLTSIPADSLGQTRLDSLWLPSSRSKLRQPGRSSIQPPRCRSCHLYRLWNSSNEAHRRSRHIQCPTLLSLRI